MGTAPTVRVPEKPGDVQICFKPAICSQNICLVTFRQHQPRYSPITQFEYWCTAPVQLGTYLGTPGVLPPHGHDFVAHLSNVLERSSHPTLYRFPRECHQGATCRQQHMAFQCLGCFMPVSCATWLCMHVEPEFLMSRFVWVTIDCHACLACSHIGRFADTQLPSSSHLLMIADDAEQQRLT